MSITRFTVGDSASLSKAFSQADVAAFAAISGDDNPVHLDADYAASTLFKRPIVHGMLTAGLVSAVIGTKMPGNGSIYLGQTLNFKKPVYLEEEITATATVSEIKLEKSILVLAVQCTNAAKEVVLDGVATVKFL